MIYFLFITLFKLVASSFCKKVADLYEQRSRRVSSVVGAYWNPWDRITSEDALYQWTAHWAIGFEASIGLITGGFCAPFCTLGVLEM